MKKGQSGNPAGRRTGPEPKSAKAVLEHVLGEATTIVINGRRRVVTVREALYRDLAYRALAGDARARRDLLMVSDKLGELNELAGEQHMTISWMPAEEPRFANPAAGGGENLDADRPPLHGSDPNDEWG
jgi:hypothetical protein